MWYFYVSRTRSASSESRNSIPVITPIRDRVFHYSCVSFSLSFSFLYPSTPFTRSNLHVLSSRYVFSKTFVDTRGQTFLRIPVLEYHARGIYPLRSKKIDEKDECWNKGFEMAAFRLTRIQLSLATKSHVLLYSGRSSFICARHQSRYRTRLGIHTHTHTYTLHFGLLFAESDFRVAKPSSG